MDLRSIQKPLKDKYNADPGSSKITLTAKGSETATPLACSVDIGRAAYAAEAHTGVGGTGASACSGDLLLGALAACAQITCQMVATAMGIPTDGIRVTVEGDLDLQGTLGTSREVPVGFENIRLRFDLHAPGATPDQLEKLREKPNGIAWSCKRSSIRRASKARGFPRHDPLASRFPISEPEPFDMICP